MFGYLWDFIVVLSALAWLVALYLQGLISLHFVAFALVAIVVLRAVGRGLGGNIGRLIRLWLGIGIPGASFLTFVIILTGGELKDIVKVLSGFGGLLIALGGLYLMIFGAFSSKRQR